MFDVIIKGLRNHSTKLWLSLTASILLIVYKYLPLSLVPSILPSITLDRWAQFSALLLILVIALVALLIIRHHEFVSSTNKHEKEINGILDTKLTLEFGILWDKNKNPHCKKCEKALGVLRDTKELVNDIMDELRKVNHNPETNIIKGTHYYCNICNKTNELVYDGKRTTYDFIKDKL